MVATQRHGLAERLDEDFTVGTGTQVAAEFGANVGGQLVVDVGRQLLEDIQATAFAGLVTMWRRLAVSHRFLLGHEPDPPGCRFGRE